MTTTITSLAPNVVKVLATLHRLGTATAAQVATESGLGYSTTTPKLRILEKAGLAERSQTTDGPGLWQLTTAGLEQMTGTLEPAPIPATPREATAAASDIEDPIEGSSPDDGDSAGRTTVTSRHHPQRR